MVVRHVSTQAFETGGEANLVGALRQRAPSHISLVAEVAAHVVGHILCPPASIDGIWGAWMGLAPVAVLPSHQNSGISTALVNAGLSRCVEANFTGVVVPGHPNDYPRFGFTPASTFHLSCEYEVPDEVFVAKETKTPGFAGRAGLVRYNEAFASL